MISKIVLVIGFYWLVSISLVFVNKLLLSSFDFPFPLLVTWFQLLVTCLTLFVLGQCESVAFVPKYDFQWRTAQQIVPLSVAFVGMVGTSNLCLHYVNVSFYQVARSLTICVSIVLSFVMLGLRTSPRAVAACVVVMIGFAIGAKGELQLSWLGLLFGVTSSVFVALYSILVKRKLALLDNCHWRLLAYNSTLAIPLMLPLALALELRGALSSPALRNAQFWAAMAVAAALGFLISVATFMQINYTTPLTANVSGTVKAAVQTVLAVVVFGDTITTMNAIGIAMVIGGSFWYSRIRMAEQASVNDKKSKR